MPVGNTLSEVELGNENDGAIQARACYGVADAVTNGRAAMACLTAKRGCQD